VTRPKRGPGRAALSFKVRIDVGQEDLMVHCVRSYDAGDNEFADAQYTNVKVNLTLNPALFKYTPPVGARVDIIR
jgi:outer membrane lipoprotein-sorting protein